MHKRSTKCSIVTLTLGLLLLIIPEVQAQISWVEMGIDSRVTRTLKKDIVLTGITGTSQNDVFAVGRVRKGWFKKNRGIILHYDGNPDNNWDLILQSQRRENLNAVCRGSGNGFFAVGDNGTIFYGEGYKWKKILKEKSYGNLQGVWVSPQNTVFAVGDKGIFNRGILLKGTNGGNNWSHEIIADRKLNAVWGISEHKLFAVGNGGIILFSKNGGNTWIQQKNPITKKHDLKSVWGITPNTVFTAGDPGIVLRFKGKEWIKLTSGTITIDNAQLNAIWVSSNPHVFIVGKISIKAEYLGQCRIGGDVKNLANGAPIPNVLVYAEEIVGGLPQWQHKGTTDGNGLYSDIIFYSQNQKLKFSHVNYNTEIIPVTLRWDSRIENHNYLVKTQDVNLISGVISKECQNYHCPLPSVKVNLYEDLGGCTFSSTPSRWVYTDAAGRYVFQSLDQVIHKIEPVEPNCTFSPQNSYVSIPQNTPPQAFDFVGQGTGKCSCTGCPEYE